MFPVFVTVPVIRDDGIYDVAINANRIESVAPLSDKVIQFDLPDDEHILVEMSMEEFVAAFHAVVATLGAYFFSSVVMGEIPGDIIKTKAGVDG